MSGENITILEGGKAENFGQVTKLKTSNGSGNDLWVPKTDVKTGHLSVKKNGLYYTNQYEPTASEKKDGKFYDIYGWDTITVSVKKKVVGKKKKRSPKTGLEYDAPTSVDVDDDGNLVETELPVYINIENPPDKLEYLDGESISKTGMVVKAYYGDDREWGVVPNNELTLDPTTAHYEGGSGGVIYEKDGVFAIAVMHSVYRTWSYGGWGYTPSFPYYNSSSTDEKFYGFRKIPGIVFLTQYNGNVYGCYPDQTGSYSGVYYSYGSSDPIFSTPQSEVNHFVRCNALFADVLDLIPTSEVDPTTVDFSDAVHSDQTITVGWTPPEGEEELTDTFDITVIPSN